MESLLTLVENHPLLKKWVDLCRKEQGLSKLRGDFMSKSPRGGVVLISKDLYEYAADFEMVNRNAKALSVLMTEESNLRAEIAQIEDSLRYMRAKRKKIIISSICIVVILIITYIALMNF